METADFTKKKKEDNTQSVDSNNNNTNDSNNNQLKNLNKSIIDKDREIAELKRKIAESKQIIKGKKGDIRSEVNSLGDPKKICIGVDGFGRRIFKKATALTDEDIERRKEYIESIQQRNAKKI